MTKNDALPFPTVLLIDCAEREHSTVALLRTGQPAETIERDAKAQELPQMIEELLQKAGILPAQLKAMALVKRGGSVTAIRIGTAAVNTLAWLERLPILEIEANSLAEATKLLNAGRYESAVKTSRPFA